MSCFLIGGDLFFSGGGGGHPELTAPCDTDTSHAIVSTHFVCLYSKKSVQVISPTDNLGHIEEGSGDLATWTFEIAASKKYIIILCVKPPYTMHYPT